MGLSCGSLISPLMTTIFECTIEPSLIEVILGANGDVGGGDRIALEDPDGDIAWD